jgi:hypothetical protein
MFREEDVIVDLERIIDVCRNGPSTDQADYCFIVDAIANGMKRLLFCFTFRHKIPPTTTIVTATATTDTTMTALCVTLTFPPAEIKGLGVGEDEGSIFGSLVEGALSFGRTVVVPKPLEFDEFEGLKFGPLGEGALSGDLGEGEVPFDHESDEFDEFEGFWLAHVFGQYICMNVFQCT